MGAHRQLQRCCNCTRLCLHAGCASALQCTAVLCSHLVRLSTAAAPCAWSVAGHSGLLSHGSKKYSQEEPKACSHKPQQGVSTPTCLLCSVILYSLYILHGSVTPSNAVSAAAGLPALNAFGETMAAMSHRTAAQGSYLAAGLPPSTMALCHFWLLCTEGPVQDRRGCHVHIKEDPCRSSWPGCHWIFLASILQTPTAADWSAELACHVCQWATRAFARA